MGNIIKIFGAPGTGKTTDIIRRITESGIPLKRIAYLSFSKDTLKEVRARMTSLGATKDDLENFYTQHSMNYRLLGLRKESIANMHMKDFAEEFRWNFTPELTSSEKTKSTDDSCTSVSYLDEKLRSDDELWNALELKRKKLLSDEDALLLVSHAMRFGIFQKFEKTFYEWCVKNEYVDFTGMIELGIQERICPDVDMLCVDEMQDNCALQNKQIEQITAQVSSTIIAGDDDQAIHVYAGADPKLFLNFPCNEKVILSETHRNPKSHLEYAQKIIRKNKHREPKDIVSLKTDGNVIVWDNPRMVAPRIFSIMKKYPHLSWFILARNKYTLKLYSHELKSEAVPVGFNFDELSAFNFMTSELPEFVSFATLDLLLSPIFPSGTYMQHGMKKRLEAIISHPDFKGLPYNSLGSVGFTEMFFYDHKNKNISNLKIKPEELMYIKKIKQEFTGKIPHAELMTLHASKGKEADCVVILSDIGKTSHDEELYGDIESERRAYYVGATRSKKMLIIVDEPVVRNYRTTII